jgi:hypothetical protein
MESSRVCDAAASTMVSLFSKGMYIGLDGCCL